MYRFREHWTQNAPTFAHILYQSDKHLHKQPFPVDVTCCEKGNESLSFGCTGSLQQIDAFIIVGLRNTENCCSHNEYCHIKLFAKNILMSEFETVKTLHYKKNIQSCPLYLPHKDKRRHTSLETKNTVYIFTTLLSKCFKKLSIPFLSHSRSLC